MFSDGRLTLDPVVEVSASSNFVRSEREEQIYRMLRLERTDAGSPHDPLLRDLIPQADHQPELSQASQTTSSQIKPPSNSFSLIPESKQPGLSQPIPAHLKSTLSIGYATDNDAGLGPKCRILVIDAIDSYPSVIVQYHLEMLRLWTANTGGPWIFQSV